MVWSSLHWTSYLFYLYYHLHILCIIFNLQQQNCSPLKTYHNADIQHVFPPKNQTNLLFRPKGPVLLIWCSSRSHPNIMHFPSPENLHTAQQTDKYLIGQPSVPPIPPWQQLQWAWEYQWVPCQSLGIKARVGTKSALLTWGRLSGWRWRRLFAWLQAPHRCQGHNRWINTKTQNNYKGLLPFP